MKLIKPRLDLLIFIFIPFTSLTILLFFVSGHLLAYASAPSWIFCLLLTCCLCLKRAWQPLGHGPTQSTYRWILSLFLSQFLMCLLIWSFARVIGLHLPRELHYRFNVIQASIANGLFPWSFMILFTLSLSLFIYDKQKLGLVSSTYEPLFKNSHTDSVGVAVDSYMRSISVCSIIMLLVTALLTVIFLFQQWTGMTIASGLQPAVFLISSGLLFLVTNATWVKFIHSLAYKGLPPVVTIFIILITITGFYLILNYFSHFIGALNPLLNTVITFSHQHLEQNVVIVVIFFSYAMSTLTGAFMAYQSRGRSPAAIVLVSLLLFLFSLYLTARTHCISLPVPNLALGILLTTSLIFIAMMTPKKYITYFLRATLPTDTPIKPRSYFGFLKLLPLALVALFSAYLGLNVTLWSFLFVLGLLPPTILIYISFVNFIKAFWTR